MLAWSRVDCVRTPGASLTLCPAILANRSPAKDLESIIPQHRRTPTSPLSPIAHRVIGGVRYPRNSLRQRGPSARRTSSLNSGFSRGPEIRISRLDPPPRRRKSGCAIFSTSSIRPSSMATSNEILRPFTSSVRTRQDQASAGDRRPRNVAPIPNSILFKFMTRSSFGEPMEICDDPGGQLPPVRLTGHLLPSRLPDKRGRHT
jgi:hypothetical protein